MPSSANNCRIRLADTPCFSANWAGLYISMTASDFCTMLRRSGFWLTSTSSFRVAVLGVALAPRGMTLPEPGGSPGVLQFDTSPRCDYGRVPSPAPPERGLRLDPRKRSSPPQGTDAPHPIHRLAVHAATSPTKIRLPPEILNLGLA